MPTDFESGHSNPAKFTPDGASETTLNITGWTWDENGDILDTTHSGTQGIQDNIAGVLRGEGTIEADLDMNALASASPTPLIRFGTMGVIKLHISPSKFHTIPCRIISVPYSSAVAGKVSYSFRVALCAAAGSYTRAT